MEDEIVREYLTVQSGSAASDDLQGTFMSEEIQPQYSSNNEITTKTTKQRFQQPQKEIRGQCWSWGEMFEIGFPGISNWSCQQYARKELMAF